MKAEIHPSYGPVNVSCSCGNNFTVNSVLVDRGSLALDVCDQCHPFYTGKQKMIDSTGNVEKFQKRYEGFLGSSDK